ncbi:Uncharacterised protein [Serratia fonticola]|uniref:Uncharacterized protein n=1 Tax=Serratia fonticola TaxID=47917 RepID=A0A3S4XC09_SERFO|nr:Uncharacterised protein [Serratia fonticola]
MTNSLAKEAQGDGSAPFGSQQEVVGLACCIHRAVQILPLSFNFDVGVVHAPPTSHGTFMSAEGLIQKRYQANNPAVKSGMVNNNVALRHYLFEIAQAEGISQIPANTLNNNIEES